MMVFPQSNMKGRKSSAAQREYFYFNKSVILSTCQSRWRIGSQWVKHNLFARVHWRFVLAILLPFYYLATGAITHKFHANGWADANSQQGDTTRGKSASAWDKKCSYSNIHFLWIFLKPLTNLLIVSEFSCSFYFTQRAEGDREKWATL